MRKVHFEARQTGGGFREHSSDVAELLIISTVYTGLPRRGCAELFVGIPLFFYADLTLPLVNPPIERGLLSNSVCMTSCGRARVDLWTHTSTRSA
jgi:hypothetical protein